MYKEEAIKKLAFKNKKQEFLRFLESPDNAIMVLATSHNDRVLARNVLIVNNGFDLYFFTWGHSRKCEQIQGNPRVALCKDRVQIEGIAEILGSMQAESNREYIGIMRKKFPDAIAMWEHRPGMVIIRIIPTFAIIGGSINEPHLEFLDLEKKTAYTEKWAYY